MRFARGVQGGGERDELARNRIVDLRRIVGAAGRQIGLSPRDQYLAVLQ